MRTTYLEVNLDAISHNIKEVQKKVGDKVEVMPVMKANAYGTGAIHWKKLLEENHISIVGVAIAEEGIALRKAGFTCEMMILNQIPDNEIKDVVKYDLIPGIALIKTAEKLNKEAAKQGKKVKVHVEVDTGMGRSGISIGEVTDFLMLLKEFKNVEIDGIYTHFSSGDTDKEYTEKQIQEFNTAIAKVKELGINPRYIHASASTGISHYPEASYNLVRPGLILLGYYTDKLAEEKLDLIPCTRLISKVTYVKEVPKGTSISYGRRYITKKQKTKIATIQTGYADGYRRELTNKGFVFLHGKLAPVVGTICMDSFMVDVTQIPNVQVGDEVILWDNENMLLEEIAEKCKTIVYEIVCGISQRVPRKYIKK